MDGRGLGRSRTSSTERQRSGKFVTRSYTAASHEGPAGSMTSAEEAEDPVINATLVNNEARAASKRSAFVLAMTCRAAPLDQVVNAGPDQLTAWRSPFRRADSCTLCNTTPARIKAFLSNVSLHCCCDASLLFVFRVALVCLTLDILRCSARGLLRPCL